ncbi:MAG TPA: hypothetical protein VEG29_06870, partial [Candidatus Binatia bacterium]|nr:hypothetical protein [Candidatus Binatia bacterium]
MAQTVDPPPAATPPARRWPIVDTALVAGIVVSVAVGLGAVDTIVPALGSQQWRDSRVMVAALVAAGCLFVLSDRRVGPAYSGAMWLAAPRIPGIAALAVFIAYVIPAPTAVADAAVGIGSYVAFLAWVILGVVFRGTGYADSSQVKVWAEVHQRIHQLSSRLDGISVAGDPDRAAIHEEACRQLMWAEEHLRDPHDVGDPDTRRPAAGLEWASGTGYLAVWQAVHRAEEAIVELEPCAAVIADALHDDLRLTNSTMKNAKSLRLSLQRAVAVLQPGAVDRYFAELQMIGPRHLDPSKQTTTTAAAAEGARVGVDDSSASAPSRTPASEMAADESPAATSGSTPDDAAAKGPDPETLRATPVADAPTSGGDACSDERVARGVVREIRFAINEFRDGAWDGLVRSRNRLLRTILVAGVVGLLLLDLAVLAKVPTLNLISAVVFFLVGALVGLFNRLRIEAGSSRAVEDFGLFEARLLHTPLLSGLAAVGGVFLIAVLPAFSAVVATGATVETVPLKPLADVFDVTKNQVGLLVAAVFGLAPDSLLTILKKQADRYKDDL